MLITPHAPYNFELILQVFARFSATALFVADHESYTRLFRMGEALVLVRVTSIGTIEQPQLQVDILDSTAPYNPQILQQAISQVLGCMHNLQAFYDFASHEPTLSWVQALTGMPNAHNENLYEAWAFTVIEQHISWSSALKIQQRMVQLLGDALTHDDRIFYTLPTPATLAQCSTDDLAPLKLTRARVALLLEIGRSIQAGEWSDWQELAPETLYERLMAVRGVGHWTASVTVGRTYGVYPYVHYNDVALQAAVNAYYLHAEKRASIQQTQATFAPYGKWAGLVANFLMYRWVLDKYP
jgi:DNA-3-methyladenine glycosylase II